MKSVLWVLLLFSSVAFAEKEFKGKVKRYYVSAVGTVLFTLENGSEVPECNSPTWHFTFKLSELSAKEWNAIILGARLAATDVAIGYYPNANSRCTIAYIYMP